MQDEENANEERKKPPQPAPSIREVLHKQSILNLICYTLLALHNIAFDQLVPIFMHYPAQDHSSSDPDFQPPLRFSGGFGLDSARIGLLFTLYGVSGMIIQFFIFPPVARRYGIVNCLRVCSVVMPITYLIIPFTALLPDQTSQMVVVFIVWVAKGFASTFAFPCSTILLTNSASSLRVLGTLNGLATSMGALGRAAGPAICGAMFTLGVERGYVIAPWWLLAGIAFVAAVPVFFLVEGEGFGGDDEAVEDSDEDDGEDEDEEAGTLTPTHRPIRRGHRAIHGQSTEGLGDGVEEVEEDDYGAHMPLLSRTDTVEFNALSEASAEEYTGDTPSPEARRTSLRGGTLSRRSSRRRMSIPLGMGNRAISRRYSSNLGQSLGSAGSFGG